jgi:hypothetical protein
MNPLQTRLREADPVAHEPPLSDADVERMRRVVMAGPAAQGPLFGGWRRQVLAAAMAGVVLASLTSVARRLTPVSRVDLGEVTPQPETRQLQFATPGGTRVVWFFNPEFQQ